MFFRIPFLCVLFAIDALCEVPLEDNNKEVLGRGDEASETSHRQERAVDTSKAAFTPEEKLEILNKHNEFRSGVNPTATGMRMMVWDQELDVLSQEWADLCDFEHRPSSSRNSATQYPSVGENLYAGTGSYDPAQPVTSWASEVSSYTLSSNTCTDVCGHYTQVVWAATNKLGCGIKFCPTLTTTDFTNAYFIVCNYASAGNFVGQSPYTSGTSCSDCPADQPTCENALCRSDDCNGKQCENSGELVIATCTCECTSKFTGAFCDQPVGGGGGSAQETAKQSVTVLIASMVLFIIVHFF